MAVKLKVDLHIHTANDLVEIVAGRKKLIPPKQIIDMAAEQNFDAIAITHHGVQYHENELVEYAEQKGLLLISGIETYIHKKHVLLINFSTKKHILTYKDLAKHKNEDVLVIAPHPFYLIPECVGNDLIRYRDCFDAVEYCHYYFKWFNLNRKALRFAQQYNMPIVGSSDTHRRSQFGKVYSYVYAEEKSVSAIIRAIKQGKVEYVSHPLSFREFIFETFWIIRKLPYMINIGFRKIALRTSQPFLIRKFATPKLLKTSLKIKKYELVQKMNQLTSNISKLKQSDKFESK
jgi:predicted metal-dependent phosphoesterase TrpH